MISPEKEREKAFSIVEGMTIYIDLIKDWAIITSCLNFKFTIKQENQFMKQEIVPLQIKFEFYYTF